MISRSAVLLLGLLLAAGFAPAAPPLAVPAGAQAGPQFNTETATQAWIDSLPADRKAKSDAYFEGGYWLILWDFLYGAAVLVIILETGLSTAMRGAAERLTRRRPLITWIYWAQFSVASFVLGAPVSIYEGFVREKQYGLMNQSFGAWSGDQLKGLALSVALGGPIVIVLLAIARRLPRTWHIWGAATATVFMAAALLMTPVFIAPLFNRFTVLEDPVVRDPILRMARQNGIPADKVYQVDASRQSDRISANVSGAFGTMRITLNDNLLNRCSLECIESVTGHEMGHYVMNHLYKELAPQLILFVLIFGSLKTLLDRSLRSRGGKWGIREVTDPAAIPVALLLISAISFVLTPVENTLTRVQEYEADIFGLNASRQPDGFAEAALALSQYRKLSPGPIEEFVFYDHPSGRTRIHAAMRWKAENLR